jgi:L-alanine-DL-glutamate epimerase-like enolase superfamily enzyme
MVSGRRDLEVIDLSIDVVERDAPVVPVNDRRGELGGHTRQGVLRVRTSEGLEGHCMVGVQAGDASEVIELIIAQIKPRILGRRASEREWVWSQRTELDTSAALAHAAMSNVDVALWDIAGKAAGAPVHELLGTQRSEIPVYATYPPRNSTPEGYEEEAQELRASVYLAYKIHPGSMATDDVVRMVGLARGAVGNEMDLMLDPNAGYDLDKALAIGASLDEQRFFWLEDPLPWEDVAAIERLTRELTTPIAVADAPAFLLDEAADYVRRNAAQLIRGTARKMGVTGLRKLCAMLEAFGLNCEIGMGGNPFMNAANLNVMLSISNCAYYEYWMPVGIHEWGVTEFLTPNERGAMEASEAPGLGLKLDEDWIAGHRVAVLT